jgi:hypothetical protein
MHTRQSQKRDSAPTESMEALSEADLGQVTGGNGSGPRSSNGGTGARSWRTTARCGASISAQNQAATTSPLGRTIRSTPQLSKNAQRHEWRSCHDPEQERP